MIAEKLQEITQGKNKDYSEGEQGKIIEEICIFLRNELPTNVFLSVGVTLVVNSFLQLSNDNNLNINKIFMNVLDAIITGVEKHLPKHSSKIKEKLEELFKGIPADTGRCPDLEKAVCMILCDHLGIAAISSIAINSLANIVLVAKENKIIDAQETFEGFIHTLKEMCKM